VRLRAQVAGGCLHQGTPGVHLPPAAATATGCCCRAHLLSHHPLASPLRLLTHPASAPAPCSRAQKSVDSLLQDLGWPTVLAAPRNATRATAGAFLAMRAEAMQLLEMRRLLQNRQMAEAGAERSKRSDKRKR
jgi:hypothetical protein